MERRHAVMECTGGPEDDIGESESSDPMVPPLFTLMKPSGDSGLSNASLLSRPPQPQFGTVKPSEEARASNRRGEDNQIV